MSNVTPGTNVTDAAELVNHVLRRAFDVAAIKNYTDQILELDEPPAWQTWSVGMLIISGCSFSAPIGMMFVPLLSKSLYERTMTFLIALGIGALSGSTLFVMIPQAFNLTEFGDAFDYKTKCWIILGALYCFFTVDRLLMFVLEIRRRSQAKKKVHASTLRSIMGDKTGMGRNATETTNISETSSASVRKAYEDTEKRAYKDKEKEMIKNQLEVAMINNNFTRTFSTRRRMAVLRTVDKLDKLEYQDSDGNEKGHTQKDNSFVAEVNNELQNMPQLHFENGNYPSRGPSPSPVIFYNDQRRSEDDSISLDIQVVEKKVVDPSTIEVASVAYMIIFGSSANNFVDGMSMGAAFSDSIVKGLSIGIAVISQQFPQELGTLAILTNSGLGLKRALLFNMIPIVLSYLGFAFGVLLDEVDEGYDSYIFAISSGMYLYIFLGTLIPEIRESTNEQMKENMRESIVTTVLQVFGIVFGLSFMFFMGELNNSGNSSYS